jgi:undecaprenyl-diphosphatase
MIFIVGSIATVGDVVWIPLVFYLYVFRKDPYDWTSSLVLAVAMVSAMALTTILKLAFGLPRPFQTPTLGIVARFETPTDHGLPSGHTTSAFAVATVVWARYPSWRIPFTLLGLATGTCMIILGLHFPSDVIAGAFLGIFCGTFAISLARYRSAST